MDRPENFNNPDGTPTKEAIQYILSKLNTKPLWEYVAEYEQEHHIVIVDESEIESQQAA